MTGDLVIQHGLPPRLIAAAARLYWQAFGGKLGRVLGPDARALTYLERVIRPENCLCALSASGDLLGLAGLGHPDGGFAGGNPAELSRHYGVWGAAWRGWLMAALPRDEDPARFLIEGICVVPDRRGQGIGSLLIAKAEALARAQHLSQVQIDVAEENRDAQRLYHRLGYRPVNRRPTGPLRWIFGISATVTLVKDAAA